MARKYKRDLSKPLSDSKFDPADTNKDGVVTKKEQKAYNKLQALKAKGEVKVEKLKTKKEEAKKSKKEKLKDAGDVAKGILGGAASALSIAEKVKNLKN
jgi:hypothetical protein